MAEIPPIPPMKKRFEQKAERDVDPALRNLTRALPSIEEKEGDEETVNPVDPTVVAIVTAEWDDPKIMKNEVVVQAVARMIDECHPTLLQFVIQRVDARIRGDLDLYFREQANLRLLKQLRDVGDMIYC